MRLSTKGRYAVMAMVDLATQSGQQKPIALADIAERQEISLSYLEQLFGKLRKGGMVRSVRGPGGGYLLARSAADTRILDIVKSVDEQIKATRCKPCLTHDLWEGLGNQIHQYLNSVSLEDIVDKNIPGSGPQFFDDVNNSSQFMVT
jgi:Rrf2 family iron-sulfur cluster assembly transcriptional regulator